MNLNSFLENTYKNIPGITIIDSGNEGKNIGIIAITHGNEPVGLDIFSYLVGNIKIAEKLKVGKIFLIANNIKAYQKYVECGDINKYRFIDDNMNRITNQDFKSESYEFQRFEQIKPLLNEVDVVIDIHSVPIGNDLIGITDKKYLSNAKNFFDVEALLVDNMENTGAVIGESIRIGKEAYGIECGNHIDTTGFENGVKNILNFLSFYGCIDFSILKKNKKIDIFEFLQEIKVKTDNFKFMKDFSGFTKIKNNQIFAVDGENKLKNNTGNDVYLGIPMKQPKKGEGAGFLFKKLN